jgi:predicted nucleic acid-binding protein
MIVADVNLIAYSLIQGPHTALARDILKKDPDWRAPAFWQVEFLNVLAGYAKFADMPRQDALLLWQRAQSLPFLSTMESDPVAALELALAHDLSTYDALYVSLARALKTVCVTNDRKLAKAAPQWTVTMEEFIRKN